MDRALDYANKHHSIWLEKLQQLLRFPTISSQYPNNQEVFLQCSAWLRQHLLEMGMESADVVDTQGGPPLVMGEWLQAGPQAPTLLVYGHYDVMPVDPLESWARPPFEPSIADGRLWGRGASDDKGQFFAVLCAIEALLKTSELGVNLKVVLEGEEEETSRHLGAVLQANAERLHCDGIVIADMGGLHPLVPLVMYGTRGNLAAEITVRGPAKDLHSGTYGGAVDNPFNVLVRLVAALQDGETRRILIPGFYDTVAELDDRLQALVDAVPITDEAALAITGAPALAGEAGYALKVRVASRPTFEVHGFIGGFSGPGIKTVIPSQATAKVTFRLVPQQDPQQIFQQMSDYLQRLIPPTVQLECKITGLAAPATVDLDAPVVQAAISAFSAGFGAPPRFVRGGGSLPILSIMQAYLSPHALITGFGLPEDGEHGPNESFDLNQFSQGITTMIHYFHSFAANENE